MKLVVANFGYTAGGWRVERHPRVLADVTGDGRPDIVGFGEAAAWVSRNLGDGTFAGPQLGVGNFGFAAGGWRIERHPRFLADVTGDGRADIVGFGEAGVWVSRSNGDGTFAAPQLVLQNFAFSAGGWRVERHPRFVADLTGDGRADIIGFGEAGVWVSLNQGNATFGAPQLVLQNFAFSAGGWRIERHPRMLADLTGDGRPDIVGFGDAGVWISLNQGNGMFGAPQLAVQNFGFTAGGWRTDRHPRSLADITGDGCADIVGFGESGVWIARNNGSGGFAGPQLAVQNFAIGAGGWRIDRHPRFLADVTGDGRADIVGFGDAGVWVSRNDGNGGFPQPDRVIENFAYNAGGWRVERHPRDVVDLNGDARADLLGFGDAGVWVALNLGDGTFTKTYVRRNIYELEAAGPWHPVTLAYANAVKALQARPDTDPRSWTYQAAVHGTSAPVPAGAVWNQCQHGSWYFLPWHRMYLYEFERIVRAEVLTQGGPEDWALPFWDYEQPGRAGLPAVFRQGTMPDGSPNPLFIQQRSGGINAGGQMPASVTSSSAAMGFLSYTPPPAQGFGGGRTTPQHFFGLTGELEFTPHNAVHGTIGGWMGNANLAALDPIFWLHHCNIDRLWEVWLRGGAPRSNPSDAAWRDQAFPLHDETGSPVQLRGSDILDTALQLSYTYEGVVEALAAPEAAEAVTPPPPAREPEMVGASERTIELAGAPASVDVMIDRSAAEAAAGHAEAATGPHVLLNIEDVEAEHNPSTVYEVFVNPPEGSGAAPQYVGNVSFFGIEHLSAKGGDEEAHAGFRRTIDITSRVAALREQGAWDDERVTVSFRPASLLPPPTAALEEAQPEAISEPPDPTPVKIGRVSLFYA